MLIYILVKYYVVMQIFSALGKDDMFFWEQEKNDMLGSDMAYILKTEAQLSGMS